MHFQGRILPIFKIKVILNFDESNETLHEKNETHIYSDNSKMQGTYEIVHFADGDHRAEVS